MKNEGKQKDKKDIKYGGDIVFIEVVREPSKLENVGILLVPMGLMR